MTCRVSQSQRRAFTLFELLVAVIIIGLILASVIPYIVASREAKARIQCAQNLTLIRNGLNEYVRIHKSYPRVKYDAKNAPESWTAFTGVDDADPFASDSEVKPNDVTASLWLLVREGYVSDTAAFVCPSSGDWPDRLYDAKGEKVSAKRRGNFRSGNQLSYSLFDPFGSVLGEKGEGWTDTLQGGCALMADKSPGVGHGSDVTKPSATDSPEAFAAANSRNHGRAGQNVLYADGSVQFERTPYVGFGYDRPKKIPGDNIYTALKPAPIPAGEKPANDGNGVIYRNVGPAWASDSFLVPTANE